MRSFKKLTALLLSLAMVCAILCSCGGAKDSKKTAVAEDNMDEHVNLVWYIRGSEPAGFKEVMEEANKQLNEKLNVTLDLRCIEAADYESKIQLASASGEEFDIMWTSNWANNFESNVTKKALMDITDYLELPELKELKDHYKAGIWDACRVNGKIYAVPIEQVIYDQAGMWFNKEITDKYGFNLEEKLKTTDDLEEVYQTVRDGEPESFLICTGANRIWDECWTFPTIAGGYHITSEGKVSNLKEYKEHNVDWAKRVREWYQKGFFPADIGTFSEESSFISQKRLYSRYARNLPGAAGKFQISNGYPVYQVAIGDQSITRTSVQSTMSAISFNSKHPVRALKLIQLMHTDKDMLNLICYGIEGRDYKKDPNNPNRMERESGAYYISEFLVGSQFLAYLVPSYEDDVWEQTKAANEAANVDKYIGFSFDQTNVATELSNITAVGEEYKGLSYGLYEDTEAVYEECQQKLKDAGQEIVKEEIDRQFEEWKATQE